MWAKAGEEDDAHRLKVGLLLVLSRPLIPDGSVVSSFAIALLSFS